MYVYMYVLLYVYTGPGKPYLRWCLSMCEFRCVSVKSMTCLTHHIPTNMCVYVCECTEARICLKAPKSLLHSQFFSLHFFSNAILSLVFFSPSYLMAFSVVAQANVLNLRVLDFGRGSQ